jgi:phage antirepressor YoqD-like protein
MDKKNSLTAPTLATVDDVTNMLAEAERRHAKEKADILAKLNETLGLSQEVTRKVAVHDRIASSEGSYSVTEAAKSLQVPPGALFDYLSELKYIYRRHNRFTAGPWLAYQKHLNAGILVHKVHPRWCDYTRKYTYESQVRVTPLGLTYFGNLIQKVIDTDPAGPRHRKRR